MTIRRGWVLTAEQQRTLDRASIHAGTSGEVLMESAGRNAAAWVLEHLTPASVVILAGPGGNGGDALVAARHLTQAGVTIQVFRACSEDSQSCLSRAMSDALTQVGVGTMAATSDSVALRDAFADADCVMDGLFGSGLSRPLAGDYAELVTALNQQDAPIISLDVPSGLPSDSGGILGPTVRAAYTLAMGYYKTSHWLFPAAEYCGDVHLVDVDYPRNLDSFLEPVAQIPDVESVRGLLPKRLPAGHKGSFGHVLLVAGSEGMAGAAILSARAALQMGTGLVTLAIPSSIQCVVQSAVPEALTVTLPESGALGDTSGVPACLTEAIERADVMAIGPGLSRRSEIKVFVRRLVSEFSKSVVIDADAIHAFANHLAMLDALAERCMLTPHPGEFSALIDSTAHDVDVHRLDCAAEFAAQRSVTLVLKGRPTVVALPSKSVILNPTGNTGLATGGSGDVLTGLLAGLLAGGCSMADAAIAGVFIHGLAADRWSATSSERSLTPSDVVENLPHLLKELES